MRWLLLKDLQILRRSPLVVALLVAYPVAIGLLIGFALSGDEGKPRVAFVSEVPVEEGGFDLGTGADEFGADDAKAELCKRVECVDADSRAEAERMVERGEVLGALILPPDLLENLRSLAGLDPAQPSVVVLVNEDDPVKAQLVDDRIQALVTEANLILSQRVSEQAAGYLDLLIEGGRFELPFLDQSFDVLGLSRAERILRAVRRELPQGSPGRELIDGVIRFAGLARENLGLALPLLGAVAEPIAVSKTVVAGDAPSLDAFAIAVAATVTLMFVTVLLVAGSLALEREENAFTRITRGPVGVTGLLGEKLVLGVIASFAVTALMLAVLTILVAVDWARAPLIAAAILAAGAAFAAFGAAIGAAAREVRASSLLAFMVSLPIAFLSLVPTGVVSATAYDLLEVVRGLFPFAPSLDAMSKGLDADGPALGLALLHLAGLTLAYGLLARLALRRFA
ncbi:MAG TPA: ABC transporter permease [Solirubrobacterales bacterium]|nr:ABC transporter permease [Solirubrobacterales bacterium]